MTMSLTEECTLNELIIQMMMMMMIMMMMNCLALNMNYYVEKVTEMRKLKKNLI